MNYQFVECLPTHLRRVASFLREEEREECRLVGADPRRLMFALWRQSVVSVAVVDRRGAVLAVAGDSAPILSREGHAWLFTTPLIEDLPLAFFREARAWLADLRRVREVVRTSILARSRRSIRFYRMLGFKVHAPRNGVCDITLGDA